MRSVDDAEYARFGTGTVLTFYGNAVSAGTVPAPTQDAGQDAFIAPRRCTAVIAPRLVRPHPARDGEAVAVADRAPARAEGGKFARNRARMSV